MAVHDSNNVMHERLHVIRDKTPYCHSQTLHLSACYIIVSLHVHGQQRWIECLHSQRLAELSMGTMCDGQLNWDVHRQKRC